MTTITVGRAFAPGAVYIGRAMPRRRIAGSPLGNPFVIGVHGTREQVIAQYRDGLIDQLSQPGPVRQEFHRLRDLAREGDLLLGCWCSPLPCHGDVIASFLADEMATGYSDE